MSKMKPGLNATIARLPEINLSDTNAKTYAFDPYLIDLARIYKEEEEDKILVGENTAKEMFHAAVGLLSISLVSMETATIYEALFDKSSVTLLFVSKDNDCADHILNTNSRIFDCKKKTKEEKCKLINQLKEAFESVSSRKPEENDIYQSGAEEASDFGLIFASDISSSEESEVEEEDEGEGEADKSIRNSTDRSTNPEETDLDTDVATDAQEACSSDDENDEEALKKCFQGYYSFLAACLNRKIKVKEMFSSGRGDKINRGSILPLLGPENRIAAVCNFRARKVGADKRVIHITFLSVRKHLRRIGIGTRIIDIIKTPQMSGIYDAIVVHADLNATQFFERNGFSGDPLLNKQWASFAGEYVNCLLMTYFPPLSFGSPMVSSGKLLQSIDKSIDDWLVATGSVHQMQYTLCKRLRAEVLRLQNQVLSQDSLLHVLRREVVKQAHTIESLRERLQKCKCEVSSDEQTAIILSLLPSPLDPDAQLSTDLNGGAYFDCAGDDK
ncbi:hypothetical protein Aperf_G00000045451 [Anoplocephala perfoliata]